MQNSHASWIEAAINQMWIKALLRPCFLIIHPCISLGCLIPPCWKVEKFVEGLCSQAGIIAQSAVKLISLFVESSSWLVFGRCLHMLLIPSNSSRGWKVLKILVDLLPSWHVQLCLLSHFGSLCFYQAVNCCELTAVHVRELCSCCIKTFLWEGWKKWPYSHEKKRLLHISLGM